MLLSKATYNGSYTRSRRRCQPCKAHREQLGLSVLLRDTSTLDRGLNYSSNPSSPNTFPLATLLMLWLSSGSDASGFVWRTVTSECKQVCIFRWLYVTEALPSASICLWILKRRAVKSSARTVLYGEQENTFYTALGKASIGSISRGKDRTLLPIPGKVWFTYFLFTKLQKM